MPQDSVFTLLQTRDGYIWVGTRGGVSRFDGVRFTTFDDHDVKQLRENEVWALAEGGDGSLWIGTYGGGLSRLKNGRFTLYTTREGLVDDYVRRLAFDASGALWIGTDHGMSRFKDDRFTNYTVKTGIARASVQSLYADGDGSLWIGTGGGGLQRFKDGRLQSVTLAELGPKSQIFDILRDRHGVLWLGTTDGLLSWIGDKVTQYTTADGLSSNRINFLHEDPAGRLWIVTDKALDRYVGGAARPIMTEISTTTTSAIQSIITDHEGSLWAGYGGDGVARFRQGLFARYAAEDGLPDNDVTTVLQDKNGAMWIGTVKGLSSLHDGSLTNYGPTNGLPTESIGALAQDNDGYLWAGLSVGLSRSTDPVPCVGRNCTTHFVAVQNDTTSVVRIRVIYPDRRGAIWAGMNLEGLAKYQANRFTIYTTRDGLSHDAVRAICEDPKGGLWIGTKGGGLDYFKDGKVTVYREKDGLPSDSVQALYLDPENTLWIATRHGMSRFKNGRFTTYTVNDGLYASHVYGLVEDDIGGMWMSCAKGIFRVAKQQLNDFADRKITSVTSAAYGLEHGLTSTMCSVAHYPVGWKTTDGRVWFATAGGVVAVDPRAVSTNKVPPPVHIEEVRINQKAFNLDQPARVAPGKGDVVFRYTALSFMAPEKVKLKYKLEGFDNDWAEADTRRAANYTNLPPGPYKFHVVGSNNDGVWNQTGASFDFYLAPHFYQTRWFYALGAIGLVLLGFGGQRLRIRQLQSREKELAQQVATAVASEKERASQLEHAYQGLQENQEKLLIAEKMASLGRLTAGIAHEMNTPLASVRASLSQLERLHEEYRDSIGDASVTSDDHREIAREMVESIQLATNGAERAAGFVRGIKSQTRDLARQERVPFNATLVVRESLLLLEHALRQAQCTVKLEGDSTVMLNGSPGRLAQVLTNLITNAIDASQARGGGAIHIALTASDGTAELKVRDEGIGIPAEVLPKIFDPMFTTKPFGEGTGLGLTIVHDIVVGDFRGSIDVESTADHGSTFTIRFPHFSEEETAQEGEV